MRSDIGKVMANVEQILRTTSALFLERGCKALTMDEIASANGVSKRTLYEQFGDKARLLEECILLRHRDNTDQAEKELSEAANVLEWFIRSLENKDERQISFYYGFFTEVKRYYPDVFTKVVRDVNGWHCGLLERMIVRGQKEGLFITGILNARQMSLQLFELSVAVTDRAVRNYLDINCDRSSELLMLFLIRGISTREGIGIIDEYLKTTNKLLSLQR